MVGDGTAVSLCHALTLNEESTAALDYKGRETKEGGRGAARFSVAVLCAHNIMIKTLHTNNPFVKI